MIHRRVAAFVAATFVVRASAGKGCNGHVCLEELLDTSSMLIMRAEIEVADDVHAEPSSKDSISALQDSEVVDDANTERSSKDNIRPFQVQSAPSNVSLVEAKHTLEEIADKQTVVDTDSLQSPLRVLVLDPSGSEVVFIDVEHEDNSSESGAASSAPFAQAAKIAERNETWTESFAAVLTKAVHFHKVSEDNNIHELPTTDQNFTVSALKQNAQQVLLFTIFEGFLGFLFIAAVMGCFCFCTVRQAQADARATAHTADIRKARETGRYTTRATTRATSRGTTYSKRISKDDFDEDEDEEWEDDIDTQDTADENVSEPFDDNALANTGGGATHVPSVRFGGTETKIIE